MKIHKSASAALIVDRGASAIAGGPFPDQAERWLYSPLFVPLALLGLTLAMFAGALFAPGDRALSAPDTDLSNFFVYARQFGFGEMRSGHLALWNPHVFSGAPFAGDLQAALFYPLNLIYLVLPLGKAIDCEVGLHVFLIGLFMALWVGRYQLHPLAVLFASSIVMFGGAFFYHVYAGHLAPLDAMVWTPLILLTLDCLLDEPSFKWVLVGICAFAMQFLGGHPQVLFNTVVTSILYGAARLIRAPHPLKTVFALVLVGAGATLITTVQLWTWLEAANEGTRHGGLAFSLAAIFSFPPENFLTLVVPGVFGNISSFPYWGRCYLWEMCPFFGLTGLTMALIGLTVKFPHKRIWAAMALVLLSLALGKHTPLFTMLYRYVPGFNLFRSHSKFIFHAGLFAAMLSAFGMDSVLRSARGARVAALALLIGALTLGGLGTSLRFGASPDLGGGAWGELVGAIGATNESYLPPSYFSDPGAIAATRRFAGFQSLMAAATLLVLAGLFFLRVSRPKAAFALAFLGVAEVFAFAHSTLATFPLAATVPSEIERFVKAHPGDYRILNLDNSHSSNSAIAIGARDIWGYDPMVLLRYAQFITYSQGGNPQAATMEVYFQTVSPLFRLLRLRFIFVPQGEGQFQVAEPGGALPHLLLINGWRQMHDLTQILNTLSDHSFDPEKTVILETQPDPAPAPGAALGTVNLLNDDGDSLTIAAEVPDATLLLITDTYSHSWKAVSLPGSVQSRYQVLPADYTLMSVPLTAGRHLFRLEYAPSGYVIGRWISLASLVIYLTALGIFLIRKRHRAAM